MNGKNEIRLCNKEMREAVNLWLKDKFKDPAPTCIYLKFIDTNMQDTYIISLSEQETA